MGGLVTSHGAGMSVPDWPNSYGYNMFLFPPSKWVGGIFFEHTHRLLGTLSGFLSLALVMIAWGPAQNLTARRWIGVSAFLLAGVTIALVVGRFLASSFGALSSQAAAAFSQAAVGFASLAASALVAWLCRSREPRRWVRWVTVAQLAAIIAQGIVGGTRVTEVSLTLAMIHGCFAQIFFCLAAFTALATSRWWMHARPLQTPVGRSTTAIAAGVWCCIFAQLVVGVLMRHNGAGLAIPDLPLTYGKLLPPTTGAGLHAVNLERAWRFNMDPVPHLYQIWLAFGHRIGAIVVTCAILLVCIWIARFGRDRAALVRPALILLALLATQLTLGLLTVYYRKPAEVASAHVAVGAMTLMTAALLTAMAARVSQSAPRPVATTPRQSANLELAPA